MRARRHVVAVILLALAPSCFSASPSIAAGPCARVISYFDGSAQACQWRIFDPRTGVDTLYLHLNGVPSDVMWDSSLTRVTYKVERDVFRSEWKLGSVPQHVARLPDLSGVCDWWFNPDSLCWVLYTSHPTGGTMPSEPHEPACRMELWRCSRDGQNWSRVLADTGYCDMDDCGSAPPNAPLSKRTELLRPDDLSSGHMDWDPVTPPGSEDGATERFFTRSESEAQRGIEFGYVADVEVQFSAPVYYVDRAHGTRQLICGPDDPNTSAVYPAEIEISGDFMVITCDYVRWRLVDLRTGRDVADCPLFEDRVMWVPSLRK